MQARPLSDVLGAELIDFDMTATLTSGEQAELRQIFAEHHLLLVRGQSFGDADHDRFVRYFGPLGLNRDGAMAAYVTNRGEAVFGPGRRGCCGTPTGPMASTRASPPRSGPRKSAKAPPRLSSSMPPARWRRCPPRYARGSRG